MAEKFPIPLTLYNKRIQSKFTDKIFRHGYRENGSMEAYTRQKQKEKVIEHRREVAMKRIHDEFEEQSSKVQALQRLIAHRQREMAFIAMEKYSATYIQSVYRGFSARKLRRRLHASRLLSTWIYFRLYLHERHVAIMKIKSMLAIKLISIRRRIVARKHAAASTIQLLLHPHYLRRKHIKDTIRAALATRIVAHAILFGTARAKVHCSVLERAKWQLYHFIEAKILRRQRIAKLRRLGGKPVFFALAHIPNDVTLLTLDNFSPLTYQLNDTLQYIHKIAMRRNANYAAKRTVRKEDKIDTTAAWRTLNRASRRFSVRCNFPTAIPSVLTGKFRIKTFYDIVLLIQDLISIATDNPATIEAMRLSAAASIAEQCHKQQIIEEQRKAGEVVEVLQSVPQKDKRKKLPPPAVKAAPPLSKNKRPVNSKSNTKMGANNYSPMLPSITAFAEVQTAAKRPASAEPQTPVTDVSVETPATGRSSKPNKPSKPKPSYRRIVSAI